MPIETDQQYLERVVKKQTEEIQALKLELLRLNEMINSIHDLTGEG